MSPRLVIIASSCIPPGTRGALTQWLTEILPGIYIGTPTTRIRDHLWETLTTELPTVEPSAYAALITHAPEQEQGFRIQTTGQNSYRPIDLDGLTLIAREHTKEGPAAEESLIHDAAGGADTVLTGQAVPSPPTRG